MRDDVSAGDYEGACEKLIAQFKVLWGSMRDAVRGGAPTFGCPAPLDRAQRQPCPPWGRGRQLCSLQSHSRRARRPRQLPARRSPMPPPP